MRGVTLASLCAAYVVASVGPAGAFSVAGSLAGGVAVGGAADAPGPSAGFGVEAAAGPYLGFQPGVGLSYSIRNYRVDKRLVGDWDTTVGDVRVYGLSAGCEYAFLRGEFFNAFGSGCFMWVWEKAKLWGIEGINYRPWDDTAPGVYAAAGVEILKKGWSLGLAPRYTVLFDDPPVRFDPATDETTLAAARSQFVDVLFRIKYSF